MVSGRDTVGIRITDGGVLKARDGGCTVVSIASEASHGVTVTVVAPLGRVKQTSGKSAAVVDDIAANLGLLLAFLLTIPQVASLAPAEELVIGLTVHTPGIRVTVLQDITSSIGSYINMS